MTPFVKMQASGNDFIIIMGPWEGNITKICHRNYGIGCDQLLVLDPDYLAMRVFNADGSESMQCGNGLRAIAMLLFNQDPKMRTVTIRIGDKPHTCSRVENGEVSVLLGMPSELPLSRQTRHLKGIDFLHPPAYVQVGNPHLILWPARDHLRILEEVADSLQKKFPGGINVHAVEILSTRHLKIWNWERGVGLTLACGSGGIASVFACQRRHLLDDNVLVDFPEDQVRVRLTAHGYEMTGRVHHVFDGVYYD